MRDDPAPIRAARDEMSLAGAGVEGDVMPHSASTWFDRGRKIAAYCHISLPLVEPCRRFAAIPKNGRDERVLRPAIALAPPGSDGNRAVAATARDAWGLDEQGIGAA